MGEIIKILGFAGSLRKESYNRSVLRAAVKLVPQGAQLDTFELDNIPPFNQDHEHGPPHAVRAFKAAIKAADAILIVTPEYNYSVPGVLKNAIDWASRPADEPKNLSDGWVRFDFEKAFGCPVKVINDAAMQALGSYEGGRMLFLGLGTGLGSALITDGVLVPMELAHLRYRKGRTYEDYVGLRGLKRYGKRNWRRYVAEVVTALRDALQADYVVLGGGNATKLKRLPEGARLGDNKHAFTGGFRLWEESWQDERPACIVRRSPAGGARGGRAVRIEGGKLVWQYRGQDCRGAIDGGTFKLGR